jgi:hypothetical protein
MSPEIVLLLADMPDVVTPERILSEMRDPANSDVLLQILRDVAEYAHMTFDPDALLAVALDTSLRRCPRRACLDIAARQPQESDEALVGAMKTLSYDADMVILSGAVRYVSTVDPAFAEERSIQLFKAYKDVFGDDARTAISVRLFMVSREDATRTEIEEFVMALREREKHAEVLGLGTGDDPRENEAMSCRLTIWELMRARKMSGDANGDGRLTAADARLALRASAKLEELDDMGFAAADLDPDGRITAREARWILRASAKLENLC